MLKKSSPLAMVGLVALLHAGAALGAEQAQEEKKMMAPGLKLSNVVVMVDDQDEALRFYTEKLGLEKRVDEKYGEGQRWLTVAAPGTDLEITLAKAAGDKRPLGAGSRWVFATDDCQKSYEDLKAKGVSFVQPPQSQPWGVQAVFKDPSGNEFFLVGPPAKSGS